MTVTLHVGLCTRLKSGFAIVNISKYHWQRSKTAEFLQLDKASIGLNSPGYDSVGHIEIFEDGWLYEVHRLYSDEQALLVVILPEV